MRHKFTMIILSAVAMTSVVFPIFAHHGSSAIDSKTVTVKGTVVEWLWYNPHCLLTFDEKTDDGEVHRWVAETQAPANMIDAGWSKVSFKPGDQVTVDLRPAKSGKFIGAVSRVVFADGKVLSTEAVPPRKQ
jgi:hypothetical protein